jgi:hypothetical protein
MEAQPEFGKRLFFPARLLGLNLGLQKDLGLLPRRSACPALVEPVVQVVLEPARLMVQTEAIKGRNAECCGKTTTISKSK